MSKTFSAPIFINKYNPSYLRDFILDPGFVQILKTFLQMNRLNLLLVGESGSGKSALLHAIIREYYGLDPDTNFQNNSNIMIINSLKEQGITYYRSDVRTFCQTASSVRAKKKILLLDDFDTLNEQSQQVFRNYIDKYSNNVCFLVSGVSLHKIIESIQSRLYILHVETPPNSTLETIFNNISLQESLIISPEAKNFIIDISEHSIRVMIHYLEKIKLLNRPVDLDLIMSCCTNINFKTFSEYTHHVKSPGGLADAIKLIFSIFDQGYSVMDILDSYFIYVKITNEIDEGMKYRVIALICKYISIFYNIHEDENELAFFTNNLVHLFSN